MSVLFKTLIFSQHSKPSNNVRKLHSQTTEFCLCPVCNKEIKYKKNLVDHIISHGKISNQTDLLASTVKTEVKKNQAFVKKTDEDDNDNDDNSPPKKSNVNPSKKKLDDGESESFFG